MFFEILDELGLNWGWLIAFHIIAFFVLYLPFIWDGAIEVMAPIRKLVTERPGHERPGH